MVHVGDGMFSTSLTCALGSLQCCRARGKTAPTRPVHGDDRFKVDRPWSRGGEGPDLTRSWWEEVKDQGFSFHEDSEGMPFPAILL